MDTILEVLTRSWKITMRGDRETMCGYYDVLGKAVNQTAVWFEREDEDRAVELRGRTNDGDMRESTTTVRLREIVAVSIVD